MKQGRHVLFSGTPCQIAGLHKYLRKDYPNLLSVYFLCHGVPSPGVWRRYLKETMNDLQSARRAAAGKNTVFPSLNVMSTIVGIEFRDKTLHGWKNSVLLSVEAPPLRRTKIQFCCPIYTVKILL